MPKRIPEKTKNNTVLETQVYDTSGNAAGKIELPQEIFGVSINKILLDRETDHFFANFLRKWEASSNDEKTWSPFSTVNAFFNRRP